jgi:hypothetical protein
LVGTLDIAVRAGVARQTVAAWAWRHDDFPEPVLYISKFPAYLWEDVEAWLAMRVARWRPEHGGAPLGVVKPGAVASR